MLRPVLPAVRPFRSGAICVFLGVALGLSAGTIGPGGVRPDWWDPEWVKTRGGMVGETLDWGVATPLGSVGAHILAIFLFLAGVLLLTGASVAGVIKFTSDSVSSTTREIRGAVKNAPRPRPRRPAGARPRDARALHPRARGGHPRPGGDRGAAGVRQPLGRTGAHRARAARSPTRNPRRSPSSSGSPRTRRRTSRASRAARRRRWTPEQLTPQGRYRSEVTDSPDFVWERPDPAMLTRSTEDANRPDTVGQEKVAAQLIEALGHFNIEARVIGMVSGPHITRYELRLAPGIKVGKVAQLKDDLAYALAAADIRILAPIPGKQAVGIEVPNARRRIVHLGDVYQPPPPDWSPLTVWLGKDVAGRAIGADLAKMPHLLVAGTTGAGKSALRERDALERSCCAPPRTRCEWCSSTPSRSSSPTTTRSRICSRR